MSRRKGSFSRYTCAQCGAVELAKGGNHTFRCSTCRPEPDLQTRAHSAVATAIRNGELLPASAHQCQDCGAQASQYDHRNYSQPLAVDPVCAGCNVRRGPAIGHVARRVGRPVGSYKYQKPAAWRALAGSTSSAS